MGRIWICMECRKEQTDQELQCDCGNIDPIGFEEKDIYNAPVTMVEEAPAVEVLVEEEPVVAPKAKTKKKSLKDKLTGKKS